MKAYQAGNDAEAKRAAQDLAGDWFIAYSTWKWMEAHRATCQAPQYRYQFDQPLPGTPNANHSAEIESVFGTQASKKVPWAEADAKLSDLMMDYWSNFAKNGDPNSPGLPQWPAYAEKGGFQVMHLSWKPQALADLHRDRYLFLDSLTPQK